MITKEQIVEWIWMTIPAPTIKENLKDGDTLFITLINGQRFTIKVKEG